MFSQQRTTVVLCPVLSEKTFKNTDFKLRQATGQDEMGTPAWQGDSKRKSQNVISPVLPGSSSHLWHYLISIAFANLLEKPTDLLKSEPKLVKTQGHKLYSALHNSLRLWKKGLGCIRCNRQVMSMRDVEKMQSNYYMHNAAS